METEIYICDFDCNKYTLHTHTFIALEFRGTHEETAES